jgi:hypothetical protein
VAADDGRWLHHANASAFGAVAAGQIQGVEVPIAHVHLALVTVGTQIKKGSTARAASRSRISMSSIANEGHRQGEGAVSL